jgi:hypothetical protein
MTSPAAPHNDSQAKADIEKAKADIEEAGEQ